MPQEFIVDLTVVEEAREGMSPFAHLALVASAGQQACEEYSEGSSELLVKRLASQSLDIFQWVPIPEKCQKVLISLAQSSQVEKENLQECRDVMAVVTSALSSRRSELERWYFEARGIRPL